MSDVQRIKKFAIWVGGLSTPVTLTIMAICMIALVVTGGSQNNTTVTDPDNDICYQAIAEVKEELNISNNLNANLLKTINYYTLQKETLEDMKEMVKRYFVKNIAPVESTTAAVTEAVSNVTEQTSGALTQPPASSEAVSESTTKAAAESTSAAVTAPISESNTTAAGTDSPVTEIVVPDTTAPILLYLFKTEAEIYAMISEPPFSIPIDDIESLKKSEILTPVDDGTEIDLGELDQGEYIYPVPGYKNVSSPYGFRTDPISGAKKLHKGMDFPAPFGTPVVASKSGIVAFSGNTGDGFGNYVSILHEGNIKTYYGHNSKLMVNIGDEVKQGQVIALIGSTGYSTGNHCHFEVRLNGKNVNPLDYLKGSTR